MWMGMNAYKQRIRGKLSRVKSQSTENQLFSYGFVVPSSPLPDRTQKGKMPKLFINIDVKTSSGDKRVTKQ